MFNNIFKFVLILSLFTLSPNSQKKIQKGHPVLSIKEILAATMLNPQDANWSTVTGRINQARLNILQVLGDNEEYTSMHGEGMVGALNQLIAGESGFGGVLGYFGYTTCDSIPTTGSNTTPDGKIEFSYAVGTKTIPATYATDAGSTFEKRIVGKYDGTVFLNLELTCDASAPTVYLLLSSSEMSEEGGESVGAQNFEAYYQQNTTTNAVYLDFYLAMAGSGNYVVNFQKPGNATTVSMTSAFVMLQSGVTIANASMLVGDFSSGKFNTKNISVSDMTHAAATTKIHSTADTATGGTYVVTECVNFSTNAADASCASFSDPGDFTIGGSTFQYKLSSINSLSIPNPTE